MAVDKLVDSTQLDADLTSIANAIRTKGGTSAQLSFPSGFVTAIGNISTGGVSSVFRLEDFKEPSDKWLIKNSVPNVLKTGGCIHIKATLVNGSTDFQHICFGYGDMNSWSPTNYTYCLLMDYKTGTSGNLMRLRFRGPSIDGTIGLGTYFDANNTFDIRFYSTKYVDVNTGNEYTYNPGCSAAITALLTQNYLSVGVNYQPASNNTILPIFAFEES